MNPKKYVTLLIVMCFFFSQLPVAEVFANSYEHCYGGTGWSGTGGSNDSDCGVCDQTGTFTQSRTLGRCTPTCHDQYCSYWSDLGTGRSMTVTQNTVSLPEQQACETAKTIEQGALAAAYAYCCIGCGATGPGVPACLIGCSVLYTAGLLAADCAYSSCVYDCVVSDWTTTSTGSGC